MTKTISEVLEAISELQNAEKSTAYPGVVDAVVCINLSTRADRRQKVMQRFPHPFYFFTSTPHSNPKHGCTQSHLDCIAWAKHKNFKNILVLEDDVVLTKSLDLTPIFPSSFDMLYLGGICLDIYGQWWQPWTRGRMVCMHAYIVNERFYDTLLGCINYKNPQNILDSYLADHVHSKHECFIITDPICVQEEDYSDLENRVKWKDFKWPKAGEMCAIP